MCEHWRVHTTFRILNFEVYYLGYRYVVETIKYFRKTR
jgi:hypothetical protein